MVPTRSVQLYLKRRWSAQVTITEAGVREIARTVSSCRVVALDCEAFAHPADGSQILSLIQLCTGNAFFVIDMLVRLLLFVGRLDAPVAPACPLGVGEVPRSLFHDISII